MNKQQNKRQVAKISIFMTSIFVILFSVTYAFVTQTLTGSKKVTITAGTLNLVLDEKNEITINDALPMYDEVGMIQEESYDFELINDGSHAANYKIAMLPVETGTLELSDIRYGLIKDGETTIDYLSNLTDYIIDEGTISGGDTYTYELRLWIRDDLTEITQIQEKFMSFKIRLDISQKVEEEHVPVYVVNEDFNDEEIDSNLILGSSNTWAVNTETGRYEDEVGRMSISVAEISFTCSVDCYLSFDWGTEGDRGSFYINLNSNEGTIELVKPDEQYNSGEIVNQALSANVTYTLEVIMSGSGNPGGSWSMTGFIDNLIIEQ